MGSVILSSCEGWVYMDNPVLEDSKSAKDAAAEALIGSWKNVPQNHRHENYESKEFLVILGNGRIKSNLYGKTDFKESVYTLALLKILVKNCKYVLVPCKVCISHQLYK